MHNHAFWHLGHVSDTGLRRGLLDLIGSRCRTEARIVAHLAAIDERRLYLKDGYSSMFDFCLRLLELSESEAYHRIAAARLGRQFPVIFGMIERREIHLSAVCLLRDHLTEANHRELLDAARGKTKLQVQESIARTFPKVSREESLRKLPQPRPTSATSTAEAGNSLSEHADAPQSAQSAHNPMQSAARKPAPMRIEPVAEAVYRVHFEVSQRVKEKLELARALSSHADPAGKLEVIVEQALDLWLDKVQKRRFAFTSRPRKNRAVSAELKRASAVSKSQTDTCKATQRDRTQRSPADEQVSARCEPGLRRKHIPNAVRREVARRDGLQCSFRSPSGQSCTARAFLQFHHETPWARGGGDEPGNLRLLCHAHNRLLAERDFGAARVAQRMSERQSVAPSLSGAAAATSTEPSTEPSTPMVGLER